MPYGSGYQPTYQSSNYGFIAPQPQGTPTYNTKNYMGQMGGGYYPTRQGHGVYSNQTYVSQSYQGEWNQTAQPSLPFLVNLNRPDLSR